MNKKRLILLTGTVCLVLFIMIYYFYSKSNREVKVLEPEYTVFKDKPKDPGGIDIPNSDSMVYEQLKARSSRTMLNEINVLPDPEKPIEINFKNSSEEKIVNSIDQILEKLDLFSEKGNESAAIEDESPAPAEVVIVEDGLDKLSTELEQGIKGKDSEEIASKLSQTKQDGNQEHQEVDSNQNDKNIAEAYEVDETTSLRIAKASTDFHKFSDTNFAMDNQNGYKIQLAMARTESEAKKIWQNLKKKHSKTLENTNLILKKVEGKNEKIFYLVMGGVFPSPYKAKLVCSNLKAHNQNCLVTK